MAANLKGDDALRKRLKALKLAFKPAGRAWAVATADEARKRSDYLTGRQRRSFRVRNASQKRATVVGFFTLSFQDAGVKPHQISPKRADTLSWSRGGRTIFARKVDHPGRRARPFRKASGIAGLRRAPIAEQVIKQWNDAA